MEKNDIFNIRVQIGDWRLGLTIPRKDELLYRDAEKFVNKQLSQLFNAYSNKTREEILVNLSYQLAIKLIEEHNRKDESPLMEKIAELEKELDKALSK